MFRDLPFYVDLLCAHVYAGYINDRGGQYLRADSCGEATTPCCTRAACSGLDAVDSETGRTRLKLIDGNHILGGTERPARNREAARCPFMRNR